MSRLIIKNLPSKIKVEKLQELFSHYGNITDFKMVYGKSGQFRQFAFVGFHHECEAEKAKSALNNSLVLNQKVIVETCKDFGVKEKTKSKSLSSLTKKLKHTTDQNTKKSDLDYLMSRKKISLLDDIEFNEVKLKQCIKQSNFVVTLKNCPINITKQQVIEFLFPLKTTGINIYCDLNHKKSNIVIASFSNKNDQNEALSRNGDYIGKKCIEIKIGCKIINTKFHKSSSKNWMDKIIKSHEDCEIEDLSESGRLYVRNLSFACTEEEITSLFEKYGPLSEVNIPIDSATRKGVGFGFITYMFPEHALMAFSELDGSVFQGRMMHILPAKAKTVQEDVATANAKSSYKKKKAVADKKSSQSTHNWNALFMGINAIADAIAEKYETDKNVILDSTKDHSAAVRLALGETHLVKETRDFLVENGISLDAFSQPNAERSKTVILVKNLPVGAATSSELRQLFEKHAEIGRVVLAPAGITAVVECLAPSEAKNAFAKLAYRNFHNAPLYLEWAPVNAFAQPSNKKEINPKKNNDSQSAVDVAEYENSLIENTTGLTLFIKNLNFETTDVKLKEHFEKCGPLSMCMVSKKKTHKSNSLLSMGYGFVTYKNISDGKEALKTLQHSMLDGYELQLKLSERKQLVKVNTKKKQLLKKQTTSKILVRNIPFQANAKELTSLFKAFGELKTVRLPKKLSATLGQTGGHRGFGFVDFVTKEDAKNAFNALCHSTHLYGRRLVLEWADSDETSLDDLRRKTFTHFHGDKKKKRNLDDLEESVFNADIENDE